LWTNGGRTAICNWLSAEHTLRHHYGGRIVFPRQSSFFFIAHAPAPQKHVITGSSFRVQCKFGEGDDHPGRVSIMTSASARNRASMGYIVPSTLANGDDRSTLLKFPQCEKNRLRKSLAENTYRVSSADLAQKIID
jgi:hypothetical protein